MVVPIREETITNSSAFEQVLKTLQELPEQIADTIVKINKADLRGSCAISKVSGEKR